MLSYKQREIAYILNIVSLAGITAISLAAIAIQFLLNELPCPLCLLQRAGILAIGIGYLMNLMLGCKSRYIALSTFAAIFTMFFAIRQVLLHITPNSTGYGDIILGAHMYSWVVIVCKTIKGKGAKILEGHGKWHHRIPNEYEYDEILNCFHETQRPEDVKPYKTDGNTRLRDPFIKINKYKIQQFLGHMKKNEYKEVDWVEDDEGKIKAIILFYDLNKMSTQNKNVN